ncbi:MAG: LacI family DNA-binding transcriptional regulator [Oscillospiraceae bacterium]|nr:LacI family DNA-binding transcriptional regulator [Oscillospiraceae bacterium]
MAVIRDVAELAGLSVAVVSKYLNHPDTVREDTRQRVEAAIKELNYVPSTAARSMRTKRSQMIAIVVPDIRDEFYADLFNTMKKHAITRGYTPILYTTENDLEVLQDYLGKISINHFDGMIPCFLQEDSLIDEYAKVQEQLPVIMMGGLMDSQIYGSVSIDICKGGYEATKHLIQQGYQRIAFIGGPEHNRATDAKFNGYRKALEEAGMEIRPEYLYYGKYRYRTGCEAGEKYLALEERPDAVFASNDIIAVGLMKHLMSHGIRIPEDFGVIGFDNVPLASVYEPDISTISVPLRDMCKEAVNMLADKIEKKDSEKRVVVFDTKLLARKSTKRYEEPVT